MAPPLVTAVYLTAIALGLVYWVYRRILPRPIKGDIPYDLVASKRPFGDIPALIPFPEPLSFFVQRCHELKSPIFQLFLDPLGSPTIVVVDTREAHDILARRTKEFDRAKFFSDIFVSVAPNNQVCLPTGDQWHANRRLMADTMSPVFLAQSAAPQAQAVFSTFVGLWHARAKLAKKRPFNAEQDIDCAMLDAITAIAFGSSSHATDAEKDFVDSGVARVTEDIVCDETVAVFERIPPPAEHTAVELIAHSTQVAAESPLGAWHHWAMLSLTPKLRAAMKLRRRIVARQINIAAEKFSNPESAGDDVRSAADLIVSREVAMAKKEGRQPQLSSRLLDDELFGFVVAGYDTTATTIKWAVKFLSQYQEVQKRLRAELRNAFKESAKSGTLPSTEDVAKRRPGYLDAVIEEILRVGNPGLFPMRTSTVDTTILGHFVPKGVDVILLSQGPSHTEPPMTVDEQSRSKTSQETIHSAYSGNWDESTLGSFIPERWLQKNEQGELEFNPRAGCQQTFGGGLRGCFGRRLAYVVLRIVVTYVTWEFEMLPLSEELGSFNNKVVLTNTPERCFVKLQNIRKV